MPRKIPRAILISLALATAIHLDWHAARPTTHHLSLGLSWHWLLAIPVFAIAALLVARTWTSNVARVSVAIVGSAILLGGVIEPAWEYFLEDATWEWAFGALRNSALAAFTVTGVAAYMGALALTRRGR